jgi:hypothetical protein
MLNSLSEPIACRLRHAESVRAYGGPFGRLRCAGPSDIHLGRWVDQPDSPLAVHRGRLDHFAG